MDKYCYFPQNCGCSACDTHTSGPLNTDSKSNSTIHPFPHLHYLLLVYNIFLLLNIKRHVHNRSQGVDSNDDAVVIKAFSYCIVFICYHFVSSESLTLEVWSCTSFKAKKTIFGDLEQAVVGANWTRNMFASNTSSDASSWQKNKSLL